MKKLALVMLAVMIAFCFAGCAEKIWGTRYYVDEFNETTDSIYITNTSYFYGKFSNYDTTNSELYAKILIDSDGVYIMLWKYGSIQVKADFATNYKISLQDDNGNRVDMVGTMKKNSDRITVGINKWKVFVEKIIENKTVKVYIEEQSDYSFPSTYIFEIEQDNFNQIYNDYCLGK